MVRAANPPLDFPVENIPGSDRKYYLATVPASSSAVQEPEDLLDAFRGNLPGKTLQYFGYAGNFILSTLALCDTGMYPLEMHLIPVQEGQENLLDTRYFQHNEYASLVELTDGLVVWAAFDNQRDTGKRILCIGENAGVEDAVRLKDANCRDIENFAKRVVSIDRDVRRHLRGALPRKSVYAAVAVGLSTPDGKYTLCTTGFEGVEISFKNEPPAYVEKEMNTVRFRVSFK